MLDIPLALLAPRRLFLRVEDVTAYKWPLVILLTAVTLIGYATVLTGLIDRDVDRQVRERIAIIESQQRDVVERSALRETYERENKKGAFEKLVRRIQVVAAEPVRALASVLVVATVLYGVVALTGRKPEWHTLLTICIFAGFIDVVRLLVKLTLMLEFGTLEVDTSLARLTPLLIPLEHTDPKTAAAVWGGLTVLDPFRIWFWAVVIIGLYTTSQLRGWRAWLTCGLCWLVAGGGRVAMTVAMIGGMAGSGAASP